MGTQSLVMFPLTTVLLEPTRTRGRGLRPLLALVRNPVVVSLLAGFACNASGTAVPVMFDRALELLSAAGPGCALAALGMSLARYRLDGGYRDVLVFVAVKNVVNPLIAAALGCVLGMHGAVYAVVVVLAAMPIGINAFVFANHYGLHQNTVAKAIVVSTVVSVGTVSTLLAVLPPS
jgi:predicted permease